MSLFGAGGKKAGQGAKSLLRRLRTGADTGTPLDLSSDEILDEALMPIFRDVRIPPKTDRGVPVATDDGIVAKGTMPEYLDGAPYDRVRRALTPSRGRQESLLDDGAFEDEALANLSDAADAEDVRMNYDTADLREEADQIPDGILEDQMRKFKRTGGLEVPDPRTEGPFLPQDAPPKVKTVGGRVNLSDREISALTPSDIRELIPGDLAENFLQSNPDPGDFFKSLRDEAMELYKGLERYAKERNMDLEDVTGAIEQLGQSVGDQEHMQILLDTFNADGSLKRSLQQEADEGVPF